MVQRRAQDGFKKAKHGLRWRQDGSRMALRWFRERPREAQEGAKAIQDRQDSQEGAKRAQDRASTAKDSPSQVQDKPKTAQDWTEGRQANSQDNLRRHKTRATDSPIQAQDRQAETGKAADYTHDKPPKIIHILVWAIFGSS